jgi:hypothetical protein
MNENKKFENAQRIKQSLIETWLLCRKHFYPEGRIEALVLDLALINPRLN